MAARALTNQLDAADEDEITVERRVRLRETARPEHYVRPTTKMGAVDARLLAIARGDLEPGVDVDLFVIDDPFGGLIPVDEEEAIEIMDDWLLEASDTRPEPVALDSVPRICMVTEEIVSLPLDHRTGFLLSHIDGRRTVGEIVDISHLCPDDTLYVLSALVALRAITIAPPERDLG